MTSNTHLEPEPKQTVNPAPVVIRQSWSFGRAWRAGLRSAGSASKLLLLPVLNRRLRWGTVAAVAALAFWTSNSARSAISSAATQAGRPLHERAAFSWQEPFEQGFANWTSPGALSTSDAGVRIQGLVLHSATMPLKNYEMNFSARVQRKAIGWVVRAASPDTYYAFKLNEKGRTAEGLKFELVRYAVVGGTPAPRSEWRSAPVVVRGISDGFLEITVKVMEDQIFTVVNGFGVDTWKHPKQKSGGLGFLADSSESFVVRSLTISGNEDSLGLFLWGAQETFRSVRNNLSSLTANLQGFLT